jgi:thiol-disulfide isomerase/thioredoxin
MKIKFVFGFALMALAFAACSAGGSKGNISGTVEGGAGETIYLLRQVNNKQVRTDSSVIGPDGQFTITPSQALALDYYTLQIGNDNLMLVTDSTESLVIKSTRADFRKNASVSGSEGTQGIQELNANLEPLAARKDELIQKSKDFSITPEAKASLKSQLTDLNKEASGVIKKWIEGNTSNPASLAVIRMLDPKVEMALYKDVTTKLKAKVGETSLYKSVISEITRAEQAAKAPSLENPAGGQSGAITVGAVAPDIVQNDLEGKPRKLSDLRGKVVLLDFWASWCGPCRKENPFVVAMYKKYNKKGFEVFSVSLDNAQDRWAQAIQQDGLIWPNHVSDLKGWQSQPAADYGVRSIPFPVLLDKQGKIVALGSDCRGEGLEMQIKQLLGS